MKGDKIKVNLLGARMIPQVSDDLKERLGLRPEEKSVGILTSDCDDACYAAIDAATKTTPVRVVYSRSMYAGSSNASTALAGEWIGILAAATPADARAGMEATAAYLNEECCFESANDEDSIVFFSHCISRSGTYLSEQCGLPAGAPLAYVIAPPMEAMLGLDAALKAAEVRLVQFYGPPSETNFAGGLLTGEQADCRAACEAFRTAVIDAADDPDSMR